MSTNYYARTPNTPADDEGLHIGMYSGGWEFLFRAHPEQGLTTCTAWHEYLSRPEVTIYAESGYTESLAEFWPDAIARPVNMERPSLMRSRWSSTSPSRTDRWKDEHGHPFANYEFS